MIAQGGFFAGREYAEIFVVFELGVIGETEEADQHHVVLHGDWDCRGDDRRGVAAVDEIDLVEVEKLGVDRWHIRGIALIVVMDELDLPSQQATLGVDVFGPHRHREKGRFPGAGKRAGLGHAEADFQRLLCGGRQGECRHAKRGQQPQRGGAKHAS